MVDTKKAIVTIAIGEEYGKMAKLTHPAMRIYARRIGAEFIVIDSCDECSKSPHFVKYRLYELLETYQRVLYVDSDALITSNCPDLFEVVPENQLGAFLEEDELEPTRRTAEIQEICGKIDGWKGTFFNSGVMVLSSELRDMFDPALQQNSVGFEYEQAQLNWNVQKLGISIYNIERQFNHIVWELDGTRYENYIIHYVFCCPPRWLSRTLKIRIDVFILSTPQPIRRYLIKLKSGIDWVVVKFLRLTLSFRKILGIYNRKAG